METLASDLRHAFRSLRRSPGFTLVAVLTLALGIGANASIFSVVNAVLLRPLPYPEPERLVRLLTEEGGERGPNVTPPDFLDVESRSRVFSAVAAYGHGTAALSGDGEPLRLATARTSAGFFRTLGVAPALGRGFLPGDNLPGSEPVVVLGHGLWTQRFGGDPAVVGRRVVLDGRPTTVVGVMPAGFDYPAGREAWTPLEYSEGFAGEESRFNYSVEAVARVRPGVAPERVRADLDAVMAAIHEAEPRKATVSLVPVPLREHLLGDARTPLLVLSGAVGLVLLIACANVANLFLARASSRRGEFAVRTALGAGRGRLVRQLLAEGAVLGTLGGAAGLLLAGWGTEALVALQPQGLPRLDEVAVDGATLAFVAGAALLTVLLVGLAPAMRATRPDLAQTLRDAAGARGERGGNRLRSGMVVAQLALSVVLLAGAGLLAKSFARLMAVDPGFRTEGALAFEVVLPSSAYESDAQVDAFYGQLTEGLRGLPGVRSVGAAVSLPLTGFGMGSAFSVEGRAPARPGDGQEIQVRAATPDFFRTLGIPLVRGRLFSAEDRAGAPPVVLLNRAAARRFFPAEDPLGKRITLTWTRKDEPVGGTVAGVVADVREFGLDQDTRPTLYVAHAQVPLRRMEVVLRTGADPLALAPAVRREVAALDPALPVAGVRTLDALVEESVSARRFYLLLLGVFAAAALALAAVGVFGVMSYSVARRTREIGLRMALGAHAGRMQRMVLREALVLAALGIALGLAGALAATRLLRALLFQVGATDPATFLAVAAVLAAAALLASWLPARRATRVDPMVALRAE
ncbi:MAG TPA: ABC transporter permease [Longimicrobiaceae bacterium]|nr:ABC transporter permease [Longimicrobiaceae bacterium]